MNVRKQILAAVVATLGTPLFAAAATPATWYAPLSARQAVEKVETVNQAGDDSGAPTSYALLSSHGAAPEREAVQAQESVDDSAGNATSYALTSSLAASPSRG